ncbi:EAL domain-containing protein [Mycolicibacterium rhodesiae]|uniref:Diguanylate phosphodiesterase n=1 Tax=Mycolicibacterium rhodesiae TaxID=36814 RepID=A0A1X0IR76_MYCRH|nr:EAL domain-containing protein [Mycolicibacterium rhodesiae]MCV7347744.1 EAL domain-containing protein [Mycolicibacterium rhodesiae]ORB50893.1 diguanylate phosphodiesterase [Mycolicibacterium rhodesiae]
MARPNDFVQLNCGACVDGAGLGFEISMAFQPIFDTDVNSVHSQEALVRGLRNEPASAVFAQVGDHNLYRFDQVCRVTAIKLAAELGISSSLNVNFMPNAVYRPELCIRTTLEAAETYDFPAERIVFEFTEAEKIADFAHLQAIVADYRQRGFTVAIDDFGAGYAGLNLLADLQPDLVKIDMGLVRDIDQDKARRAICKGIVQVSDELGIGLIAEGIERREEMECLQDLGVHLFQGYYIARPAFESVADVNPEVCAAA